MESLSPRLLQRSSALLESVVSDLQTALGEIKDQFPQLVLLASLVDRVAESIRVRILYVLPICFVLFSINVFLSVSTEWKIRTCRQKGIEFEFKF